jgi:hypothetical protein
VQPDFRLHPRTGFGKPNKVPDGEKGPHGLAVAVTGSFPSSIDDTGTKKDAAAPDAAAAPEERLIKRSPPDTRVVVAGSSSFVTDEMFELSRQAGADYVVNNFELVQNMVDWAVADTDLLAIRSRGGHTRLLEVGPDSRGKWEWTNYGIMGVALAAVIGLTLMRRSQLPIELDPPPAGHAASDEEDAS